MNTPSVKAASQEQPGAAAGGDDLGAAARRGLIYIPMAKAWFLVAGLLMQILLPRVLGSSALFGMWTLVLAWLSTPNNVMVTATIQAVSHFAATGAVEASKRAALRMNLLVGGGTALGFFLVAPLIAGFEHDEALVPHLRLASAIVLFYSFYAVFVGAANGSRQFHKQAGLDMTFATLRVGLVLLAAALWHATLPAVGGFVLAAAIILVLSATWVGLPKVKEGEGAVPVSKMIGYIGWLIVYLSAINVLMFLDGWWLKRLLTEAEIACGTADVKHTVDALVGVYGAAQTVARLPYQLILAGAFVIFPLLSVPAVQSDRERAQRYITATLRYSLIIMLGMVVALGTRPEATLRLLYPAEYSTGAAALSILLVSYACFSLLTIIGTITNSLGHTVYTAAIGAATALGTTLAVYLSIRGGLFAGEAAGHIAEQPLRSAALGLLFGMGGGLIVNLIYLYARLRATLPLPTLLRVAAALAVSFGLFRFWPAAGSRGLFGSKLGTLLSSGLSLAVYLGVLFVLGELSVKELLALRRQRPQGDAGGASA
jgi:O-antigen/teichoic acid export membrane protein